jgi:hypothetical protein
VTSALDDDAEVAALGIGLPTRRLAGWWVLVASQAAVVECTRDPLAGLIARGPATPWPLGRNVSGYDERPLLGYR